MTASLGSGTTLDAIFVRAIQHHQNGQLREAESCYRAVLGALPDHPDANHNMGIIALQCGQPAAALPFVRKAVKSNGAQWQYWVTYIETLAQLGDRSAARAAFKQLRKSRFPRQQIDALLARLNAPSAAEVTEATRLFESNDTTNGESFARELIRRYPAHGFGWKALALFLHKRGQLDEAVTTMTEAAKLMPSDHEVHYNLGVFEQERIHDEVAVRHYRQAIDIQPYSLPSNFNLAFVLLRAGRHVEAEAYYRRVIALAPSHDGAYNNYAGLLRFQGRQVEAEAMYTRLLLLHPDRADAYSNLAVVFQETDRHEKARRYCRIALALSPDYVEAFYNYGNSERELGFLPRAEQLYWRGLRISPQAADAANNLGFILLEQGHPEAAEEMFVRSMKMRMTEAEAKYYAASTLAELGFHALAEARYQQLLQEDSGNIDARASLALLRAGQGRQDEAEQDLSFSIERASQMIPAQSNLLFSLNYNVSRTAEEIFAVYKNFDERMAAPLRATWSPHRNNREHDRRLKVGYVSPDFRYHSTRMFLAPLLAHHDREAFEIYAFAEISREDAMTERYRAMVDHWIPTRGIGDADLAARIRELGIDILVDLAGHTAGNRLAVFARKPAPVSLTWMGYNYTTGLSAIDYFLTDASCAPIGSEHLFAEQPWRIEELPFAFRPAEGMGEVSPLPAISNGYVTFGTLSRSVRINHRTVRVWAELLKRVPNSRLVVNSANFKSSFTRDALAEKFEAHGVSADRLEMGYDSPPWDLLRTIDITLDCFPHCSGTTLFESLYMGLPFATLLDRPSVGRLGAAILKALGRPEWIAETEDDYIDIAAALAHDLPGLAALRATLRSEMQASRIMDETGTTRRIEQAYRQMWRNWCETAQ